MIIKKYTDFILEELDTAETYSNALLTKIKSNIQKMFDFESESVEGEESEMTVKKAKILSRDKKNAPTFKEFGVSMDSLELSTNPSNLLTLKFSDDSSTYTLYIKEEISSITKDMADVEGGDFSIRDIESVKIKFKKSNKDTFEVIGQLDKNVKVKKIDEGFLIGLKMELDEMFGSDDESFEIET
jgi:hypothetical protein